MTSANLRPSAEQSMIRISVKSPLWTAWTFLSSIAALASVFMAARVYTLVSHCHRASFLGGTVLFRLKPARE